MFRGLSLKWTEGFQGEEEIGDTYLSIFISDPSFRLTDSYLKGEKLSDYFKNSTYYILLCFCGYTPLDMCYYVTRRETQCQILRLPFFFSVFRCFCIYIIIFVPSTSHAKRKWLRYFLKYTKMAL